MMCCLYRTFSFHVTYHLRDRVFGRYRQKHMYVIRTQMPLLHQTFLLSRKFFKNFSKTFSYLAVYSFFPVFRDKNNVIFAFPTRMFYTTVHFKISPFVYPFEDSQKGDISSNSENVKRFWVPQWNWGFTRLIKSEK